MDEFGVLTARYGLKPQGKSAPMAALKQHHKESPSPNSNSGYNLNSMNGSFFDDHDALFGSSKNENLGGDFDVFGGFETNSKPTGNGSSSFDYDSIFSSSSNSKANGSLVGGGVDVGDDIFISFPSNFKQNVEIDDLLGGSGSSNKSGTTNWNGSSSVDDLISGFGSSSVSGNGQSNGTTKADLLSTEDPFDIFESASMKSKSVSTDPLEEMAMFSQYGSAKSASSSNPSILKPPPKAGQVLKFKTGPADRQDSQGGTGSKYKEAEDARRQNTQNSSDDLEFFFAASSRSSSVPKSRSAAMDSVSNAKTKPEAAQRKPSKASSTSSVKKVSPEVNLMGDFSSIFGDVSSLGEFEEVEGESEERRRARLGRLQRTNERVAKAVADMNDRDCRTMLENEEKSRIAETMDAQVKRWVAGKEGNMRALLSSLQYVLWPECGWEVVSLTDLITSTSVKKVYRKATLCVHPDKVQQKGATIQQKYIAEKVFDILKEAWNKFSKEELK